MMLSLPAAALTLLISKRLFEVNLMSLDEVLNMSANKIRTQLASHGIKVPPLELKN